MQNVYPGAIVVPSPGAWSTRNGCEDWAQTLVLHATQAGYQATEEDVVAYFANNMVCSHILIGRDGQVWQFADPLVQAAAANGTCTNYIGYWNNNVNGNWYSSAIEIFKLDNGDNPTDAQYEQTAAVSAWICDLQGIPRRYINSPDGGICSHGFFDPAHRSDMNGVGGDPGTFDWARYFRLLGAKHMGITIDTPGVRNFFREVIVEGDVRWESIVGPYKGTQIRGGLLADYKGFPVIPQYAELGAISEWGLPTGGEFPHPDNPKVAVQRYERKIRYFDMGRAMDNPPGVKTQAYGAHIDYYYALPGKIAVLEAKVAMLSQTAQQLYEALAKNIKEVLGLV